MNADHTIERSPLELGEAFAYVWRQPDWIRKLLVVTALGISSVLFVGGTLLMWSLPFVPPDMLAAFAVFNPALANANFAFTPNLWGLAPLLLFGLVAGAALLGYTIEILRRVRDAAEVLLPDWNNWEKLLRDGGLMLLAYALYILSNIGLLVGGLAVIGNLSGFQGAELTRIGLAFCGLLPLVSVYAFIIMFMTSICMVPFAETGQLQDFFRWGWAWQRVRHDTRLTFSWFGLGIAANLGFSAAQSIPVVGMLGVLLSLAMQSAVQGHLLGQYAAALSAKS
jgi:hypothetical protein